MKISTEYILQMREILLELHSKTGQFVQSSGADPVAGSQAAIEQSSYLDPKPLVSACSIGTLLIDYGSEHLTGFVKLVTNPVEPVACFTCVRSMLESCALSAWLLDPEVDAQERVGRVFARRYEGLVQQIKLQRLRDGDATAIQRMEECIEKIEHDALSLGFSRVVNRKNIRIAIGCSMPGPTQMIQQMLDEEWMYRMLSAVAHGHYWAITGLGYQPLEAAELNVSGVRTKSFEKTPHLEGIALLGTTVLKAFARPLWNQCRYFGWDSLHLEEIFEDAADRLRFSENLRFWRS